MKRIAILLTCYNRKEKTVRCLRSLEDTYKSWGGDIEAVIYLTDDGCTDGTADRVRQLDLIFAVHILRGSGSLYWNGGMINSWKAAINDGGYDGYLWLNDDTVVLPDFWSDVINADRYSKSHYGKGGIYVGSTKDEINGNFTYGGFIFTNKWTLKDSFVYPNGESFLECQCAHGNITFVSQDVVDKMGIFYEGYIHGGGDHDYSYRAYKAGYPVLVMPHYCGECENDHIGKKARKPLSEMNLKERISTIKSPIGSNLHNSLLFQRRCFPHRYIFALIAGYGKICFPKIHNWVYLKLRK